MHFISKLLFFVLLGHTLYAQAVPSQDGLYYKGPMKLTGKRIGASMWLPLHWQTLPLKLTSKNTMLVLHHEQKPLNIEIYPNDFNAFQAVQYLQKNIILPTGTLLTPSKRVEKISSLLYRATYNENDLTNKRKVIAYILIGPQHRSLSFFGFYDVADEYEMKSYLLKFVKSVSFTPTRPLPETNKAIKDKLSGGRFVYYSQKNGYSTKKEIWLCSNQKYIMHKHHQESYGTWRIQDEKLVFKHYDATESFVDIKSEDGAIYFSGVRVYRLKNRKCD